MNILVLKFGGTSVANNEKLNIVAQKIQSLYDEGYSIIAVVSAQGKQTDTLLNEAYELTDNPSARELDVLLSTGEQETIAKLGILLSDRGYKAVSLTGWQAGIHTSINNQNAIIDTIDKTRILKELQTGKIVIIAGFQGINSNDDITTLGRGGSDTTAVALASVFDCKCYIYSDVDGVFTSDPRKVTFAKKLPNISYEEMLEMSNEGAKVLHNRCIEIAKKFDIPIIAKSTFENGSGTIIDNRIESVKVKSIVKNDETIRLIIKNTMQDDFIAYNLLLENEIFPSEYKIIDNTIMLSIKSSDFIKAKSILEDNIKGLNYIANKYSKISIIGYGIINNSTVMQKIINTINKNSKVIDSIEITNNKVRIIFKEVIPNETLQDLHYELIK